MTIRTEGREEALRAEGAEQERRAILAIVEQHLRLVAHGHGADGSRVLEHLLGELEARDQAAGSTPPSATQ